MQMTNFLDFDCVSLSNNWLNLLVTQSVGPRIICLRLHGEDNPFANLPDFVTIRPDGKAYHFYGGHRLWHAPEHMLRTYILDDSPVDIIPTQNGLSVIQPPEPETGIQKSMSIELVENRPQIHVTHELTNLGSWAVECAPWAITQLKTGGVAILPQNGESAGLLPNRALALWPYTDMASPNVHWGSRYIWINAQMTSPLKIGFANPRGWMAYWLNGSLFVKRARYEAGMAYYDFGSSSECYCNDQFLELETLAPIRTVQPGTSVSHVETWELYKKEACPCDEQDIQEIVEEFGLM